MPQTAFNVSAVVFQNETNFCLQCMFRDDSASACVLIYYNFVNTHKDDLIFLKIWKTNRVQREAYNCTTTLNNPQPDGIANHVAITVFAFSDEKHMIYGQPLNYTYIYIMVDNELKTGNGRYNIFLNAMLWVIDVSLNRAY